MINENISYDDCCGCTACVNICPTRCIEIIYNEEGFNFPLVEKSNCTKCGKCLTVCPVLYRDSCKFKLKNPIASYATKHKDTSIRMKSSSGGMYTAISDYILSKQGVVFGAIFDNNNNVIHACACTKEERDRQRGSKYVQSDISHCYNQVKRELDNGRLVLFSGTPCQVEGLNLFLGDNNYNLITCDLVCLGVNSPLVWKEYKDLLAGKENRIKDINFRDKRNGWNRPSFSYSRKDVKKTMFLNDSSFGALFYSYLILRKSCYYCRFTNWNRPGDLTIADFWGIEKYKPHFADSKGVSLLLVNSDKGKELFSKIINTIEYEECSLKEADQRQFNLPVKKPENRNAFWKDYKQKGYNYIVKKYTHLNVMGYIKRIIKKIIYFRFT